MSAELRCPHDAPELGRCPRGRGRWHSTRTTTCADLAPAVRSESLEVIQRFSRFLGEETDLSFRISEFAWDTLMLDVLMEVGLGITQVRHLLS